MKKFKSIYFFVLLLFPLLTSCLEKNNVETGKHRSLLTVKVEDNELSHFETDSGKKVNIGEIDGTYKGTDNQRAFVYYDFLDEKISGFDHNIKVYLIRPILTKPVVEIDNKIDNDSVADHNINVKYSIISKEHLNLEYWVYHSGNEPHMLNLIDNKLVEKEDDDYVHLEFRHNNMGDTGTRYTSLGVVSFILDDYHPEKQDKKGIILRVNTSNSGVTQDTIKWDPKANEEVTENANLVNALRSINY